MAPIFPLMRRLLVQNVPALRKEAARRAYARRMEDLLESSMLLLKPYVQGKTFIDVGANEGSFCYHLKLHASQVVAFEPIPSLAEHIRRHNPSVEVHNCALGLVDGYTSIHVPYLDGSPILTRSSLNVEANVGFHLESQRIRIRRLDNLEIKDVGVIKIDVEGVELDVILGAKKTISDSRPVLMVEIEDRHHPGQSASIIQSICDLGYVGYYVNEEGGLTPADNFNFTALQAHENLPHPVLGSSALYLNNFIFLPVEVNSVATRDA